MNIRNNLQGWLENLLIVFSGLIIIFIIGGDRMLVPPILQVLGRSHPLILHFPIVLMVLALVFVLVPNLLPSPYQQKVARWSLLFACFFAGITVLTGWMLSQEEGYEGDNLILHKWMGVAVFFLAVLIYFLMEKQPKMQKGMGLALLLVLIGAGHWGANLTHGTDFLMAPITSNDGVQVNLEEAEVFAHLVQPILEQKCNSCHQASKSKGQLRLDEVEMIQKGGKNGVLFDEKDWENSLFVKRLVKPIEEKGHMPPKGKAQLSPEELQILQEWVKGGAKYDEKLKDTGEESPLFQLASLQLQKEAPYDFETADADLLASLNNFYRVVAPLYPESPALEVSYFGASAFDPASLQDLKKVKDQIVGISLNKMPLKEVDLSVLAEFKNLEELKLNFCDLGTEQLKVLGAMPRLRSLSLAGNKLSPDIFQTLAKADNLAYVYLWSTGLSEEDAKRYQKESPHVMLEWGFSDDGIVYALNPPQIKYSKVIFDQKEKVEIKHGISSVEVFYTLDGSEPDSINSLKYESPIIIDQTSNLKARAFATGWTKSNLTEAYFYKSGIRPENVDLKTSPSGQYQGKGKETLFDLEKGDSNYASGDWLGFKDEPMILELSIPEGGNAGNIAFSFIYHEQAHIFPPVKILVQGKMGEGAWKTIIEDSPKVPEKRRASRMKQVSYPLDGAHYDHLRIEIHPNQHLPSWHRSAGGKGWVFIDEVVIG
ncbi:chitobiase/beta-hexosaminidase C-terminal domain-containing protein [Echinicola marina]|uniref:FN3 associated domain-containing protein n=1 Tax=Echinicola marina TaxID=2859768 RepID=UPI001CF68224|nr:FN3 associated domain-containing protein [Echinicola marina]UCS91882.1 chitobiase/beta-hexosaminidase C-terminal domain-containing protein [Echinicola marina]